MRSGSLHGAELDARLERLRRLADRMDARFRIPGTRMRFGWDSILGLIPGVGDAAALLPGVYLIHQASRMGVRRSVLARMAANAGIDFVVGGVPLAGDIFDLFFKSNRRNLALLEREFAVANPDHRRPEMAERNRSKDGTRETEKVHGAKGTVSQGGREGGRPARQVASRDEKKRSLERPAGATRVTGSMKEEDDDKA